MPRCVDCGQEIDLYQNDNYNQLCPNCLRERTMSARYKLIEELIQYRNETEAGLFLLAITSFVAGIFLFLIFHPLLILLSIVGIILIIFSVFHNKKTKQLRKRSKQTQ